MINNLIFEDIREARATIRNDKKFCFENKTVLIPGGAGFLGSWLCDFLLDLGANVECLDDFSSGKMENICHLLKNPNFKLTRKNICKANLHTCYDFIVYLAGSPLPSDYQEHPTKSLQVSSIGCIKMLELAKKYNSTILLASTSHIYGDPLIIPTPETNYGFVSPVDLRSPYVEGKRFAEALFTSYSKEFSVDVRIARIYNTYGPRSGIDNAYAGVIWYLIEKANNNQDILLERDGTQRRSFCYVTDTCLGLLLLLCCKDANAKVINVGSSEEQTIIELANKICNLTQSKSKISFCHEKSKKPLRRCPNIDLAKNLIGWTPKVNLEEGLSKCLRWFV
jgi:UDP-glucuronate decarboxylase